MLKNLRLVITTFLLSVGFVFAQTGTGSIKGTVTDKSTGEALPFVKVIIYQGEQQKGFAATDISGKFLISSLAPGQYDVELRFVGYQSVRQTGVIVSSDKYTILDDLQLGQSAEMLDVVEVITYSVPLIDKDGGASGGTVTREDISKMPTRDATGIASTVGGVYSSEGGGGLSIRGARSEDSYYYIDGIKVRGSSSLPKAAMQEVSVITGGVPANYGDVTGGIISITTRGPSSQYFGSFEGVTSGFYLNGKDPLGYDGKVIGLDKYAYNLVEGMISGPLLMKKDSTGEKTKPILGFFISANFTDELDSRPTGLGGTYRIKQDVRDSLLASPLRPTGLGQGTYYNASFLRSSDVDSLSDFEQTRWRMNARGRSASAAGKIDVNAGPSINLTFGGSASYTNGRGYSYNGSLMNFENFGLNTSFDWRVYGRFTQRFSNSDEGSSSKIKNAYYSIMIDYSQSYDRSWDATHQDRIFNYGHVGTFTTYRRPTYEFNADHDSLIHNGYEDTLVAYSASQNNQAFAAITSQYYQIYADQPFGNYQNLFQLQQGGALRNGDVPDNVYGIWDNLGTPYNYYGYSQADQFRITGSGTINLSDHAIALGFEYEQRWDRNYGGGPIGIWTIARQYMNNHILEYDKSVNGSTYDFYGTFPRVTYDRLNAAPGDYGGQENNDAQYFFDYNVRKKLGEQAGLSGTELEQYADGTNYVDIDALNPNFFTVDMFSADELLNSGNTIFTWYGYDHTGQKVRGNTDIKDYFTEFNSNGNYARHIGAFQPIYMAGYVMDKFAFDDIIFNVGMRVDIFDANQPVMKDKYLLYTAKTKGEVTAFDNGQQITHPVNIGDDYVVYVNDVNNITAINGYRHGDTWYDADGVEVSDPSLIAGSKGIAPWLTTDGLIAANKAQPTADAFGDYKPQINVMPRIAFSFPISDEASFFAHYDILTKRPTTGNRFDPIDYQFMQTRNVIINNPDLKPEKTIDYELGFQQVLSKTSSLKISAFYKEQRNQVQLMNVVMAYPNTYRTYGNRDFGTVKGMTISYDLRRTGNIRMTAAYTLQFASGTGSDPNSAAALINSGSPNLRTIFPYSYDQRHGFSIVIDYRYGTGKDYRGPKIGNFEVFGNTGLNLVTNIGSGTPYSGLKTPIGDALMSPNSSQLNGTVNGSRKPWTYRMDLQLDRNFNLEFGADEDKKKAAYLNVYCRVTNLFNIMNVLNVYRATGNATDDGYLAAAQYQTSIQSQLDEQSFRDYYMMKVQNPFNLGLPRTIRIGVKFDF